MKWAGEEGKAYNFSYLSELYTTNESLILILLAWLSEKASDITKNSKYILK